jgi:hypothetical protein
MKKYNGMLLDLIQLMRDAEQFKNMSGADKKAHVIRQLQRSITLDNTIEELILDFIDIIILVDKNEITINPYIKHSFLNSLCCYFCK